MPQHTPGLMNGRRKGCVFTITTLIYDSAMYFFAYGAKINAVKRHSFSPSSYTRSARFTQILVFFMLIIGQSLYSSFAFKV